MAVDLHIHTTASDGSTAPLEVVAIAKKAHLSAISVTDHDTVSGVCEILEEGELQGLSFLPGVEISSTPPSPFHSRGSFHILGYGMDPRASALASALASLRLSREERNPKMVAKLQALGISITLDEVVAESAGKVVGRPHMASVLVKKKVVPSVAQAFGRFLAKGRPAYVEKGRIPCENAIHLIRSAGGLPVLAHPVTVGLEKGEMKKLVGQLSDMGLSGLEAFYSTHSPSLTNELVALAAEFDLLVTGGSDFHGSFKPDIALGVGRGDLHVPDDCYAKLVDALP